MFFPLILIWKGGALPDYWAQEMIGADLLKKENESAPPPKKKPFVQLFDRQPARPT